MQKLNTNADLKNIELRPFYSQLSLRRTPSGPASAVRLREVSGLQRVDVTWPQEFYDNNAEPVHSEYA